MKCVVPGTHVRLLGKAIHSLAKIGDELYIEHVANGVAFRTVNSSRSAYACFTFAPEFFERYDNSFMENSEDVAKCKIAMKSCTAVFKNLSTIEKTVEKCKINLDSRSTRVVFQLHCKHGIVRTFNLAYIECETLQAVFSKSDNCNTIVASTRLLSDTVQNFQNSLEEVTLTVSSEKTSLKNYTDDEPDPNKVVHTEMTLDPEEFETYEIEVETDITFCMKEFRAVLSFSEVCNFPVTIYFETSGKPVVFSVKNNPLFEADFVLATLGSKTNSQSAVANREVNAKKTTALSKKTRTEAPPPVSTVPETRGVHQGNVRREDSSNSHSLASTRLKKMPRINSCANQLDADNEFLKDLELQENAAPISVASGSGLNCNQKAVSTEHQPAAAPSLAMFNNDADDSDATTDGEGAANNDTVPGTPPSKRFKSMFLGLSQASHKSKDAEVLASDTDSD